LSDDNNSVGRPLVIELTLDLHGRAAASAVLSTRVIWRIRRVEKARDPGYVAPEFHMPINNLGINLRSEHHCCPSSQYLVGVLGKKGHLGAQRGSAAIIVDDCTNSRGVRRDPERFETIAITSTGVVEITAFSLFRVRSSRPVALELAGLDHIERLPGGRLRNDVGLSGPGVVRLDRAGWYGNNRFMVLSRNAACSDRDLQRAC